MPSEDVDTAKPVYVACDMYALSPLVVTGAMCEYMTCAASEGTSRATLTLDE